jgi:hypothetical protein
MATTSTTEAPEARPAPFVPPITPEELAPRNAGVIALLDAREADAGSEQDQRETMDFSARPTGRVGLVPTGRRSSRERG